VTTPQDLALRDAAVAERWALAVRHLEEAQAVLAAGVAPLSTVHSAYHAMHHAARAVLILKATGPDILGPRQHGQVVQEFGMLIKNGPAAWLQAGRDLNRMMEERTVADYRTSYIGTSSAAQVAVTKAIMFLELCRTEFGLKP